MLGDDTDTVGEHTLSRNARQERGSVIARKAEFVGVPGWLVNGNVKNVCEILNQEMLIFVILGNRYNLVSALLEFW